MVKIVDWNLSNFSHDSSNSDQGILSSFVSSKDPFPVVFNNSDSHVSQIKFDFEIFDQLIKNSTEKNPSWKEFKHFIYTNLSEEDLEADHNSPAVDSLAVTLLDCSLELEEEP